MTNTEFDKITETMLDECKQVLQVKSIEYAPVSNRLISFKRAGAFLGVNSKVALLGMLTKHLVSIYTLCEADDYIPREKIVDSINYLILLEAINIEECGNE